MNRRTFARGGVSLVATGYTAGCLSRFSRGTVGLHVLNWSMEEQTFDIRMEDDGEEYAERITLPRGESARREDILRGGRYAVTVSIRGGPTEEYDFRMGECEDQEITVTYEGATELEITRNQC